MRGLTIAFILMLGVTEIDPGAMYASPDGTAFTYQGSVVHNAIPVTDTCDFRVSLWPANIGGSVLGTEDIGHVNVVGGLFLLTMDFGAAAFSGEERWLELAIKCPQDQSFQIIGPRQPIDSVPYAIHTRGFAVDENGNVGIGTTAPKGHLHIDGGPPWTSHSWNKCLALSGNSSIELGQNNPNTRFGLSSANDEFYLFSTRTEGTDQPPSYRMVMDENGNLGIGTSPSELKLEIAGDFGRRHGSTGLWLWGSEIADRGDEILHIRSGGGIVSFDGNDNVGIGTSNPQAKLDVAGTLRIQRIQFPDGTIQTTANSGLSPGLRGHALFNTPGTHQWTCPPDVHAVLVEAAGGAGGGGGGGSRASSRDGGGGGGGGSGGYWRSVVNTNPGMTYAITVGAGGTGGLGGVQPANGVRGGDGGATRIIAAGGVTVCEAISGLGGAGGNSGTNNGAGGAGGTGGISAPANALRGVGEVGENGVSGSNGGAGGAGGSTEAADAVWSSGGYGGDGGIAFDPDVCDTTAECVVGSDGDDGDDGFVFLEW